LITFPYPINSVKTSRPHIISLLSFLLFLSAFILYGIVTIRHIRQGEIWGPNDELAHLDYLDRLAYERRFPREGELISDHSHRFHDAVQAISERGYDGTKQTLGPIAWSYEAYQPPVYYFVMALPYRGIMSMNRPPQKKLELIRLFSFGLHFLGMLAVLLVFYELKKMFPSQLRCEYGYVLFLFVWLCSVNQRFGVNNDHLCMLMVNLSLWAAARARRSESLPYASAAAAFSALACLTKLTNVLVPVLIFVLLVLMMRDSTMAGRRRKFLVAFIPFFLFPAWYIYRIIATGNMHPLESDFIREQFGFLQPGMISYPDFLRLHFSEFFNFNYISPALRDLFPVACILILAGLSAFFITLPRTVQRRPYLLIAVVMFAALYAFMFFLNRYKCCVVWYSFRLYSGYMIFTAFAMTGFLAPEGKYRRSIHVIVLLLLHFPLIYLL